MIDLVTSLSRKVLFTLEPEDAHALTLTSLNAMAASGAAKMLFGAPAGSPVTVMGLDFPNAVGLAAGADKNGECIEGFGSLGFGFLELGGVTPRPQPGNEKPRVFRLPDANAVINRLGFNNHGVERLAANLARFRRAPKYSGVIGVNLGKNKDTPNENALDDYRICYERLHDLVDFATINVSSPNTAGLRALQEVDELRRILEGMANARDRLSTSNRRVPLSVKIAPDLTDEQIGSIAELALHCGMDAITATNTTIARDAVKHLPHGTETGGLSGAPVFEASNAVIRKLKAAVGDKLPIIGVGGVMSGPDARAKLDAGASLVQFYTGLIYRGPALVHEAVVACR